MNAAYPEDQVRRAHEVFQRNHEAARQELLEQLAQEEPPRVACRPRVSSRLVGRVLAAVALVLLAVTLGISLWLSPQRAYALEDMPQRLLELKSIYLTGWVYAPDETKHPMTIFAERGKGYWQTSYSFTGGGDGKPTQVKSQYVATRGGEQLVVQPEAKSAIVITTSPLVTELNTEMMFQLGILNGALEGQLHEYTKIRTEKLGDVMCDVYERSTPQVRSRVWLNPQSGLPVHIARYSLDRSQRETPETVLDHVEVNVSAETKGLSFTPPEGYEVTRVAQSADANPLLATLGSGSLNSAKLAVWYAFRIDDRTALVCWFYQPSKEKQEKKEAESLSFTSGNGQPCEHVDLATVEVQGNRWQWSLVSPKQAGQRLGDPELRLALTNPGGGQVSMGSLPLRFPEERLRSLILEVQKATQTKTPSGEPFTLDSLRAKAAGK